MGPFRFVSQQTVRWRSLVGAGMEHLSIKSVDDGLIASSVVIGERYGMSYGVVYSIVCDATWRVRRFEVTSTDGRQLWLASDGAGRWRDRNDEPLPQFDGCIDVDLSGTPFTNTIPIRRLQPWKIGERVVIDALYVPFDDFVPVRDQQRYTCLEQGRRFLYEAVDGGFSAQIEVDDAGLALSYPPLFERANYMRAQP